MWWCDDRGATPLQRRLARLSKVLGAVAVALSAVVMVLGLAAGRPPAQMAITPLSPGGTLVRP